MAGARGLSAWVPSPICSSTDLTLGEVVYRSATHRGEHELLILDRELFETVQAKLAANAVTRQVRIC